ncbi:MAG: efflux RND transporter periplasmic adaptor subunit [bacterium]|nr:efflux RND transporter periplasmic adaptor subunit [bacterium]
MKKIQYLLFILLFAVVISCNEKKIENEISASGTVEATDITISSKSVGQISSILVSEGDKVKKDDILLLLDHESLDIQLRQAEAGVEQAEAQLRLLQAGARKEDIRLAQEQVNLTEINLRQAGSEKQRGDDLFYQNVITKQQHEEITTRFDQATNQFNIAKENLKKIKNIVRPEEIASASANLKRSRVSVDLIRYSIEDCTIKSPSEGIVTKKFVEAGEFVTPGASLLNLSDLQTVKLVIYVTEVELGKVKLGQTAEVSIDSYKDKTYKGEVIFISTEAEFTPKNIQTQDERTKLVYAVKIQIPNPEFQLKSGMPADAKLILN